MQAGGSSSVKQVTHHWINYRGYITTVLSQHMPSIEVTSSLCIRNKLKQTRDVSLEASYGFWVRDEGLTVSLETSQSFCCFIVILSTGK